MLNFPFFHELVQGINHSLPVSVLNPAALGEIPAEDELLLRGPLKRLLEYLVESGKGVGVSLSSLPSMAASACKIAASHSSASDRSASTRLPSVASSLSSGRNGRRQCVIQCRSVARQPCSCRSIGREPSPARALKQNLPMRPAEGRQRPESYRRAADAPSRQRVASLAHRRTLISIVSSDPSGVGD